MAQVTGRGPERQPLPVIVTRIEPNDGLINANDVWVREPATDTASNGIVATLAGKHGGSKKKKKGLYFDALAESCSRRSTIRHLRGSPPLHFSSGNLFVFQR